MNLIIDNIRSFSGHHEYKIRPLTLLVGENSSGKSTFLAALAAVSNSEIFPRPAAFNKAPYDLGTFDTIATYRGGRGGRAKSFSLGYSVESQKESISVTATYCSEKGEVRLKKLEINSGSLSVIIAIEGDKISSRIVGIGTEAFEFSLQGEAQQYAAMGVSALITLVSTSLFGHDKINKDVAFSVFEKIQRLSRRSVTLLPRATSISPIRSEPKRTYDRLSDEYDPGGDHIPFALARLLEDKDVKKSKARLDALLRFGEDSGLFRKLNVKRLGSKSSDPFQVQIAVGGPSVNMSDVGYGVSQSLPIIVESILRERNARLLLQQPEVHLHPQAQAALGSFFAELVSKEQRQFVIETHSDYLIDRIRQEVAAGELSADSVGILYFDRPHVDTTVHALTLDGNGNITNAPASYRKFFIDEEIRLLSRSK